jgi:YfiH family protein
MKDLRPQTSALIGANVPHGFFGREGGGSDETFAGLNCGYGSSDDAEQVTANRARVAATLGLPADRLLTVYQTHSADVLTVTGPHDVRNPPRADAMVTDQPGLGLGILTADCAPILLADEDAGVIGAAHAGWRGAIGGVIENTVDAMVKLGARADHLCTAVGPTISQANYEVGEDFRARFVDNDPANAAYFAPSPKPGHCHFDLPAYCGGKLARCGVRRIECIPFCTYRDETSYFSYRRATHRGEPDYGRNISVICLAP